MTPLLRIFVMVFLLAAAKTFLAIKMEKIISLGQDIKKKRNNQKRPSIEYIILGILSDHLLGQIIFYSLYLGFFSVFLLLFSILAQWNYFPHSDAYLHIKIHCAYSKHGTNANWLTLPKEYLLLHTKNQ